MDRQFVYPGQIPLETDLLNTNRNALMGLGYGLQDMIGTSTQVSGLPCAATAPATMTVNVGAGRIYSLQNLDNSAYSSLPADTTDTLVKQGVLLQSNAPVNLSCPAPVTAGYSINYLIEAAYQDSDTNATVLPYYNAANPTQAYAGPNNTGAANFTKRQGLVALVAKPGIAATTGSQTTPAADSGYVGLYVVTVAYGATTITSANISTLSSAPFISLLTAASANGLYQQLTGKNWNIPTPTTGLSLTVNGAAGSFAEGVYSPNTLGQSFGLLIQAGSNNTDAALSIKNAVGTQLATITGSGNMVINVQASGPCLTMNGINGYYAAAITSPTTTPGQSLGLTIQAGTTTADYALVVATAAGSTFLAARGDGTLQLTGRTTAGAPTMSIIAGTGGSTGLYVQNSGSTNGNYTGQFNGNGSSVATMYVYGGSAQQLLITGAALGTPAISITQCATTGAQTATFTASNKPGSGTTAPSIWLPILLGSTTYYIPCWQ